MEYRRSRKFGYFLCFFLVARIAFASNQQFAYVTHLDSYDVDVIDIATNV